MAPTKNSTIIAGLRVDWNRHQEFDRCSILNIMWPTSGHHLYPGESGVLHLTGTSGGPMVFSEVLRVMSRKRPKMGYHYAAVMRALHQGFGAHHVRGSSSHDRQYTATEVATALGIDIATTLILYPNGFPVGYDKIFNQWDASLVPELGMKRALEVARYLEKQ